ncbi:biopolymer transporter ExbD [Actibacterium ureilyticum]|uniref:biopolymer transporter ExbD n=1 Tax=Actibacterium ureilyticum TaxID=1590614 RepID=UPI000BAB03E4|nr:biopolymer transporter ExbD [Actibacterium ureilyticum]
MTSLIDIIFLLLLFFMLTSTFTRYAEVELMSAASGAAPSQARPLFLRLTPEALSLNGQQVALDDLGARLSDLTADAADDGALLLVSPVGDVTAQGLVDVLTRLRDVPHLAVRVLGAG